MRYESLQSAPPRFFFNPTSPNLLMRGFLSQLAPKSLALCLIVVSYASVPAIDESQTWKQFRGNSATAVAGGQKVPVNLSKETLRWSVRLPGPGTSSPVIWGERLFVTSENREAGTVTLLCLDSLSGKLNWSREIKTGAYHVHNFNNLASGTPCATDSHVVLGWYDNETAHAMLTAYSHEGDELWTQDLGRFDSQWGVGFNPAASDDRVIVGNLHKGGGSVVAYRLADGKLLWSRPNPVGAKTSYAAPLIRNVHGSDAKEVVFAGELFGMVGVDFETGKENWSLPDAFNHRTITSPIIVKDDPATGEVLVTAGNKNNVYFAVRMPQVSEGNVATKPEKVWAMESRAPYVPTPAVADGVVYALADGGTLSVLDGTTGVVRARERLLGNFYASPVLVDGKLYCLSREGDMWVVQTGDQLKVLRQSITMQKRCMRQSDITFLIV